MSEAPTAIRALAADDLYPAVLDVVGDPPRGKILDVPAGHGAFANRLLELGCSDIDCLDINESAFALRDERVRFTRHDAAHPLPFPNAHFDVVFSIEGIEHFVSPWTFVIELCRVLKPGGRMYISTPNTFSVDARLKYLVSGYFPRFRPLMQEPHEVMNQDVDDAHISPIYFWQLNYFLMLGGVSITRIGANPLPRKGRWAARVFEKLVASMIRSNMKKRGLPDPGISSDAVLFGDCLVIEGRKAA